MELLASYFDAEVRGFDLLPERGPMLLVGNHSGATLTPDTSALIAAWYRERGLDSPLYGLAFDAMFGVPGVGTLMRKIGQLPASMANAAAALERGGAVLVYPGGEHEVFRPWTDRNRIDFDGRKGFVRLALKTQVPVVPVVGHGGHESTIILTRGTRLAELCRLDRLRVTTFPLLLQVPWGLSPAGWPSVPLPAKIVLQLHEPLDWSGYGTDAADDPHVVDQCYDEITELMQDTLSELARERPYPLASRVASLVTRRVSSAWARALHLTNRGVA
jgi:1-acyl-sn-glycerol-3-phosphate acyltransferase